MTRKKPTPAPAEAVGSAESVDSSPAVVAEALEIQPFPAALVIPMDKASEIAQHLDDLEDAIHGYASGTRPWDDVYTIYHRLDHILDPLLPDGLPYPPQPGPAAEGPTPEPPAEEEAHEPPAPL